MYYVESFRTVRNVCGKEGHGTSKEGADTVKREEIESDREKKTAREKEVRV